MSIPTLGWGLRSGDGLVIGLVLVSHVAAIAEGAAQLARQMGGAVPIAAAGGIEEGDGYEIGTDAMRVLAAVEEVWSDDGVLVFMDLGSALLSADLALDMLEDERRAAVRLTDAPLVEGAVAAAAVIQAGADLETAIAEARRALQPKRSQLGGDDDVDEDERVGGPPPDAVTRSFTIGVPAGLHARPVAMIVGAVGRFEASGWIADRTTGSGPVPASGFGALATLGVRQGHEIEVSVTGRDADALLDAIGALVEDDFGERPDEARPKQPTPRPSQGKGGIGVSPGIAVGPATRLIRVRDEAPRQEPSGDPAAENARLEAAVGRVRDDLQALQQRTTARAGATEAAIFAAHLALLDDPEVMSRVRSAVDAGTTASEAWASEMREMAEAFERLDDPYQAERAADVRSVAERVEDAILGRTTHSAPSGRGILLAEDLDPAQTADLDRETVHGIVTARGGPTSHSAILARALGIPAIVGAVEVVDSTTEGTVLVIDGDTGSVEIDPDSATRERAERAVAERKARLESARRQAQSQAVTRDGTTIDVEANLGAVGEAAAAVEAGADGVGLLRTEFLFLDRLEPPTVDEQEDSYRRIAEALSADGADRRLTVRTLDIGGDKPVPFVEPSAGDNPFLGIRGLRLGLARTDLLDTQLAAIVRVAADHPVGLMFPMVTTQAELEEVTGRVGTACEAHGVKPDRLEIGIMVEVPAAALCAARFAPLVDFFSIGTNDLTQYVMAAERGVTELSEFADPLHPAVLRSIAMVTEAAGDDVRVAVCGEAAGDPAAIPILVGLGVSELSVAPGRIPEVKQRIRSVRFEVAREVAQQALDAASADEVRRMVGTRFPDEAQEPIA